MARCCNPVPNEFAPSYASVLAYGNDPTDLCDAVHDLEANHPLTSCFTAWCSHCKQNYLLTTDMRGFPSPSAHHTHQLALLQILRESGIVFSAQEA